MTLGATPIRIAGIVAAQGVATSAAGITLGLLAAAALNRTMEGLVFGVETTDRLAHGAAALVLILAALAACVPPTRRAVRVDPVTTLRSE